MTAPGSNASASPVAVAPASSHDRLPGERLGMRISESELIAMAMYARLGSITEAAYALGKNPSSVKNLLSHCYEKLGVYGAISAFRALGWLRVPEELTA